MHTQKNFLKISTSLLPKSSGMKDYYKLSINNKTCKIKIELISMSIQL